MNTITTVQGNHHFLRKKPIVVRIEGEIDDDALEQFRSSFNKAIARNQPLIPVVIHTTGGDVYDALAMMALMQSAPMPVVTIVPSHAYSAGVLLFAAGTKGHRYIGPNATLMMHDTSVEELSGNCRTITHEASELKRINTMMYRLLAENCGQRKDFFSRKVRACEGDDLYINAETAHKWKLADHLALPQVHTRISIQMTMQTSQVVVPPQTRFVNATSDDEEASDSDSDSDSDDEEVPKKKRKRKDKDDKTPKRTRKESVTDLLARIMEQASD